ncbi:hypothetical protein ABZ816_24950 [Actinosynnema sp. NPDC047251]|uniref:Putative secreted protein n=1 Tax=Saccharothrix espanaensis (strain ATCC 51144 / DSM 44229 / JCM 9112 / NBRC 15066 / NRRL 15764) TaxID=1179773 RepID=K0JUY6_SACES|nr:hypothetical protein [Saccharothrix espanaensis]CCH31655.1 putative secreted protein [Saccharothrix espanaensis DSM 44229]
MGVGGVVAAAAMAGAVAVGANSVAGQPDDDAWRELGLKVVEQTSRTDQDCVANSFGQVKDLLTAAPCRSLSRLLFTLADDKGSLVAVSVAWVEFGDRAVATEFRRVEDIYGTGDITPLSARLLLMSDITFTAHHYDSEQFNTTVVVAEAENVKGAATPEFLHRITEVAVLTPRP